MSKTGVAIGAFVVGAAAGAIAGLLYAPKSGRETRALVADKAQDAWGATQEFSKSAGVRVNEIGSTVSNKGKEVVSQVRPVFEEKNDELKAKIDVARKRIAAQVNKNANGAHDAIAAGIPVAVQAVSDANDAALDALGNAAEAISGDGIEDASKA